MVRESSKFLIIFGLLRAGEISISEKVGYNAGDIMYALEKMFIQFFYGYKPISHSVKEKFVNFFNQSRLGQECGSVSLEELKEIKLMKIKYLKT